MPYRYLILLMTLLVLACSGQPKPAPLQTLKSGTPAMWLVSSSDTAKPGKAYLFGTIHVLPDGVTWRSKKFDSAMDAADRLVIEVTGLEDTARVGKVFANLAVSPGQPPLEDRVKPELRDELETAVDASNVPTAALNRMESWAVALSLASAQTARLGLNPDKGVEKSLTPKFSASQKPVIGLETIRQQLGYFDQLPEEQQRIMLEKVLTGGDESKLSFEKLFNAWISGDMDALADLSDESLLEQPETREKILVARNRDWAEKIDKMLENPETLFIAVGAAHLAGDVAVQEMLKQRGYIVQRIQ